MKTLTKFLLTGSAFALGGVANAQITVPPTTNPGGSDLVLFVSDTTNDTSFVQDLGVNLDSLGASTASITNDLNNGKYYSTGNGASGPGALNSGTLTVASGLISNGIDSALATYLSEQPTSGQSYVYTIIGAGIGDGSTGPGQGRFAAGYTAAQGVTQFNAEPQDGDAAQAAGSTTQFFAASNAGTQQYAITAGSGKQAQGSFGATTGSNGASLGTAIFMYELSSTGTGGDATVYASTNAITFGLGGAVSGVVSAGGGAPVPLPAAIWLLGSGVLGLFGIGRRRAAAAA
jgi:hypothetical protein